MNTKIVGERGELRAEAFLKARGYRILERNHRSRMGEIDLIALDGDCLCFIEVKTREQSSMPQEAVSRNKQRKLARLAAAYLQKYYGHLDVLCRFDVVAIDVDRDGKERIRLITNAFEVE